MQHPLENPSLAPYGLAFPISQKRLEFRPDQFWVNAERVMARVWAQRNRANARRPLPVTTIIHEIMPGMATANRITQGDFHFEGLPYLTRDIMIFSSVMQWFGSNVGSCFLEWNPIGGPGVHPEREFTTKFATEMTRRDMVAFWAHTCTPHCTVERPFSFVPKGCYYRSAEITPRDRAVVEALMRWLGRKAGRTFVEEYQMRLKRVRESASERSSAAMRAKRIAAQAA